MPTPRAGESQKDFVKRCIPVVLEDGTAKSQDQAVAVCYSMWRREKSMDEETTTTTVKDVEPVVETEEKMYDEYDAGPISFSELKAEQAALEAAMEVNEMAHQFPRLVRRIFNRPDVEDKDAALETLAAEFVAEAREAMEMERKEHPYSSEFILPDGDDELTKVLSDELKALGEDDLHYKFVGSPRNKYGTHSSFGFKGNYARAWRIHFSKVGGGALTGAAGGPIRGTVRRTEMIAAGMKPPCKLPSTESIGARTGGKSPLPGSFPGKPGDYGLSSWAKPENEQQREGMKLSCKDLAVIKRAALAEIKWRQGQREKKEYPGLFAQVVDALKSVIPQDEPPDSGLMIWKEADGSYRWLARYSNNFRDQDDPPEIIAEKSHQRFVEMVDSKEVPPPDLWLWHVEDWRWGAANWVAYDDAGFALAGGTVHKGFEPLAEHLMALDPADVGVSHGMLKQSIKRDEDDPSIIVQHITREISPLPAWAAANTMTGFILSKEANMAIPDEKRQALQEEWNLSPDLLGSLEAANAESAKEAEEAGTERKEKDGDGTTQETAPAEQEQPLSREELGQVVTAIGQTLTAMSQQMAALAGEVKELKEARAAEDEETLTDLFQRAIGHEQARVDGRTKLAKAGPKETPHGKDDEQSGVILTGNPLVDNMVNSLVSGDWVDGFVESQQNVEV